MGDMNNVIAEMLEKHLRRLSWKCKGCTKLGECEELPSPKGTTDYEPRYCLTLLMAAINENSDFQMPFPKQG